MPVASGPASLVGGAAGGLSGSAGGAPVFRSTAFIKKGPGAPPTEARSGG